MKRAPAWLKRPAGVAFGFGNRLVSFKNTSRQGQAGEHVDAGIVTLSHVSTHNTQCMQALTHRHKLTHHISDCMDDPALLLVLLPICCLLLTCCRTESLQNSAGCRAGRLQSWLHILCILVFLLPSSCASLWAWHDHHALNNAGVLLCFF